MVATTIFEAILTIGMMMMVINRCRVEAFSGGAGCLPPTSVRPVDVVGMRTRTRSGRITQQHCNQNCHNYHRPTKYGFDLLSVIGTNDKPRQQQGRTLLLLALSRRSEEETALPHHHPTATSSSSSSSKQNGEGVDDDNLLLQSQSDSASASSAAQQQKQQQRATTIASSSSSSIPSYRQLLLFCSTTILIWLSEPLLSLVDTTVVGAWTCPTATATVQLASLGPATTLIDSLLYTTYFLSIATTNRIASELAQAQNTAASNRYRQLQRTTSHVLCVAIILGAVVTLTALIGAPLLLRQMMAASDSMSSTATAAAGTHTLLQYAARYTRLRATAAVAAVTGMTMQSFSLAVLDTRTPALAVLAAAVTNTVADVGLTPRYGVAGAAVATALSSCVSASILARSVRRTLRTWRHVEVQLWQSEQQQQQKEVHAWNESTDSAPVLSTSTSQVSEQQYQAASKKDDNAIIHKISNNNNTALPPHPIALLSIPDRKSTLELIALAGPIFYVILAKVACYGAMTVRCTAFGVPAMAAHSIMMRIFFFFSTFGDSLSQTAQSFLPATLYSDPSSSSSPGSDDHRNQGFVTILRRLMVVAVALAVTNANIAVRVLQRGGRFLTRDVTIVGLMRQHTGFLGASILLHPLIMLLEGTVIASRNFRSLVIIYTGTLAWQLVALKFLCGSFPAIWRTFFLFQLTRLGLYAYRVWWGKRKDDSHNSSQTKVAVGD